MLGKIKKLKIKKILPLHIVLVAIFVAAFIFVVLPKLKPQPAPAAVQDINCIKNKDQAVKILRGTDIHPIDSETQTYVREVEARGNKVFFDEYPDGVEEAPSINYINIGEELKNGSKLLHARYSYHVSVCDTDLDKEDIVTEGQVPLKFTYKTDGKEEAYTDETMSCLDYSAPEAKYYDFNKDGNNEILIQCYAGSGSAKVGYYHIGGSDLFVYSVKDGKLDVLVSLWNERGFDWKVQDFNNDGYLDLRVGEYMDCENNTSELCAGNGSWVTAPKTYVWDNKTNKFAEAKIGEE